MGHTANVRVYMFIKILLGGILARIYRFSSKPATITETPYLVISNHVTNYDPILLGIAFNRHMYFVAGEHLHRGNLIMKLATVLFSPISRIKGKSGASTTLQIIKALRKGANVCLFAEGNTTFNGVTERIPEATGKLAKITGATLVTYRIEGAYFASPRWGRGLRNGPVNGQIVGVYTPKKLKTMSVQEVTETINDDIFEDAFKRQLSVGDTYRGKRLAERLELALYMCPKCEEIGALKSSEHVFSCSCGFSASMNEKGFFEGEDLPFTTIRDWDFWQDSKMSALAEKFSKKPLLFDRDLILRKILQTHEFITEARGALSMSSFELRCGDRCFPISTISGMAIHGPSSLVFSVGSDYYEIKPVGTICTRKYYTFYHKLKEIHQRRGS